MQNNFQRSKYIEQNGGMPYLYRYSFPLRSICLLKLMTGLFSFFSPKILYTPLASVLCRKT